MVSNGKSLMTFITSIIIGSIAKVNGVTTVTDTTTAANGPTTKFLSMENFTTNVAKRAGTKWVDIGSIVKIATANFIQKNAKTEAMAEETAGSGISSKM